MKNTSAVVTAFAIALASWTPAHAQYASAGPDFASNDTARTEPGEPVLAAPTVVLKLDDLTAWAPRVAAFQRVASLIYQRKIKAGFGLIGNSLVDDGTKQGYYDVVRGFADSGRIEIWHHGYDHADLGDGRYEFSGPSYRRQLRHMAITVWLLAEKCGVTVRSFGAPFNLNDLNTVSVLERFPQIKVWMFPSEDEGSTKVLLRAGQTRVNMEPSTGVVDYQYFVDNYNRAKGKPIMVLQGHPGGWTDESFQAFDQILDFLDAQGVTYKMPYEVAP
ncbi:MAG TPA: polysaccharide deacetylase family protein [Myxococcaceae bacterium]|nr:polysaccharide deacetylase family protein [Myxococcaceae bacterium]